MTEKTIAYSFFDCEVCLATREVKLAGELVDVQPKVFRLIAYLIANRQSVVSKDSLQKHIWQDAYISDTALTRAIMKARKAIGDDAQKQTCIKTVHGDGYRFIAKVEQFSKNNSDIDATKHPIKEDVSKQKEGLVESREGFAERRKGFTERREGLSEKKEGFTEKKEDLTKEQKPDLNPNTHNNSNSETNLDPTIFLANKDKKQNDNNLPQSSSSTQLKNIKKPSFIYVALVTFFLALLFSYIYSTKQKENNIATRVAILPFETPLESDEYDWTSLGLMSLVSKQLNKAAKLPVVSSRRILATQKQLGNHDKPLISNPQARELLHEVDAASHFVQYTLEALQAEFQLSFVIVDVYGNAVGHGKLIGESPTQLALDSAELVAQELNFNFDKVFAHRIISKDSFLNEAYSRGLSLQLRGKSKEAMGYFKIASEMDKSLFWPEYEYALSLRTLGELDTSQNILQKLDKKQLNLEQNSALYNALGLLFWRKGDLEKAKSYLEKGLAFSEEAEAKETAAALLGNLAIMYKNQGQFDKSRNYLGRSLAIYQGMGVKIAPGWLSNTLASLNTRQGNFNEANEHYKNSIDYFRKINHERNLASSLSGYSDLLLKIGEYKSAEKHQLESLKLRNKIGDERGVLSSQVGLFDLNFETGKFSAANLLVEEMQKSSSIEKNKSLKLALEKCKAKIFLHNEKYDAALSSLNIAESITKEMKDPLGMSKVRLEKIKLYLRSHQLRHAKQLLPQVMQVISKESYVNLKVIGLKLFADLAILEKDPQKAEDFYKQSMEHARQSGDLLARAKVELALANLYLKTNQLKKAEVLIALISKPYSHFFETLVVKARLADLSGNASNTRSYLKQAKLIANERWSQDLEKLQNFEASN